MAGKKKGLLDSILHPGQDNSEETGGDQSPAQSQEGEGAGLESAQPPTAATVAKTPKAKKSKVAAAPVVASEPEGMQPPTGPLPGDYVDRSPADKQKKLAADYAAGAVDRMGEVRSEKSDEQK